MIVFQVLNFDPVKEILKIIKYILIQEYQHKLIRVNTNQHESDTSQHELTRGNMSQKESKTSQHESDTSQHESTRVKKCPR